MLSRVPLPADLLAVLDAVESSLEEVWSLARIAQVAGSSPYHFHRSFRAGLGETPAAWVERLRLERAAVLLLASPDSIGSVALEVGFRNHETFSRRFRARFDVAPREYRGHQLANLARLGLEPGRDPAPGDGEIVLRDLDPVRVQVRRAFDEDEGFSFDDEAWPWSERVSDAPRRASVLDFPGVTEPGRVRLEWAHEHASGPPAEGWWVREAPGGLHYALRCSGTTGPVPVTAYQRLFVRSLGERYRLRPGPIVELRDGADVTVCQPVFDSLGG